MSDRSVTPPFWWRPWLYLYIDAIAGYVAAGEAPEDVAADMGVPVEAVEAAVAWKAAGNR